MCINENDGWPNIICVFEMDACAFVVCWPMYFQYTHHILLSVNRLLKVIRKFFLKHNKSFRWHLGDYEKHNLLPFEGL